MNAVCIHMQSMYIYIVSNHTQCFGSVGEGHPKRNKGEAMKRTTVDVVKRSPQCAP